MEQKEQGLAEAFAWCYETYYSRIFAYVWARVRERDLAEELVAETFAQAYAKFHTLRDPQAVLGWLLAIARNLVAAHYRRQVRERGGIQALIGVTLREGDEESPSYLAEQKEIHELLAEEISRLSPREQEVLRLKFEVGLKSSEISRLLGIKETTVRVMTFRALAKLRRSLAQHYISVISSP